MIRLVIILLLFSLFGLSSSLQARPFHPSINYGQTKAKLQVEQGKIRGSVIDSKGAPIPFINIIIEGIQKGTTTDFDGDYKLKNIRAGHYILTVSGMGYTSQQKEIHLKPGQELSLNFRLQESILEMDEVMVNGQSATVKLRQSAKAVSVLETKEIKLQTADLGQVLTQISGVNVRRSGGLGSGTRFSLNGLTDDQIRFMIDGIPLDFMGYSTGIANVPINLIDRVEIYKGVVPIDLGADALGGAVNLISSKDSLNNGGSISYQLGSFGTHRIAASGESKLNDAGLFIRGSAYFDYAKNDYDVDVEIPAANGKLKDVTVPRFHDAYQATGLRGTFGVRNRKWADELSVEVFGSRFDKDIQNNNIMSIVYGKVTSKEENYGALARYRNQFSKKIKLNVVGGYTERKITFIDTSRYIYTWLGDVVRNNDGSIKESTPGEIGQATDLLSSDHSAYGRFNFNYQLAPRHNLRLSSAPTYVSRTIDERFRAQGQTVLPPLETRTTFNLVNGLAYNWRSANRAFENTVFIKDYLQRVTAEEKTNGAPIDRNRQVHHFGFGDNLRYKLNEQWLFKVSYEWATRLPRPDEVFGNGRLVRPNLSLKPERSHNANLKVNYSNSLAASTNWEVSLNGFLRSTDQLILLLGNNEIFSYQNVFSARSLGVEASAYWESKGNRLRIEANTTWQDFRNQSSDGQFGNYKGDRIPNRPHFFANGKIRYRFPKLFDRADELSFFLVGRYVKEFYRGWESVGLKQFKDVIPSQFVQNFGLTYKLPINHIDTAFTAEVQNLTNTNVYDFFGVQRPGRAFYFKITTQL